MAFLLLSDQVAVFALVPLVAALGVGVDVAVYALLIRLVYRGLGLPSLR